MMNWTYKLNKPIEGLEVGVGSCIMGDACVIFPVETIRNLTGREIGQLAKSLYNDARCLYFLEMSLTSGGEAIKDFDDERLQEAISTLSEYKGGNEEILKFKSGLEGEAERRRSRRKLKNKAIVTREKFSKMRDRQFIRIGRRDGFKCNSCGTDKYLSVDHKVPVSKGGTSALSNLQILCRPCNSKKGVSYDQQLI
jgi:HNH endonuclease